MSRTDELMQGGARSRTGRGGGAPFVKWGDDPAWVEGKVLDIWEGKYGMAARVYVADCSDNLEAGGKDEMGPVEKETEVNIGLNYAALEDSVTEEDRGAGLHFAFTGWGKTKDGTRFREFAVLEVPELGIGGPPARAKREASEPEEESQEAPDDELPF